MDRFKYADIVEQTMKLRRGRKQLLQHLRMEKTLTRGDAILAKCYECSGGYEDGKGCDIPACPLYTYCPFKAAEDE